MVSELPAPACDPPVTLEPRCDEEWLVAGMVVPVPVALLLPVPVKGCAALPGNAACPPDALFPLPAPLPVAL